MAKLVNVAILVFPGVQSLDVSGPLDVFAEANGYLPRDVGYRLTLIGSDTSPFRASNGMLLSADISYADVAAEFDLVLVAGGPHLSKSEPEPGLIEALLRLIAGSEHYGSICSGTFVLGHAGLLRGRSVTTHWQDAQALADQFPEAQVDFDRIFIRDGALVTSAGVTAGIDLALAIVNEDHGAAVALAVAKRLVVVAQRQGGQSQFSPYLAAPPRDDSLIAKVYAHVIANLRERLSVGDLAAIAGTSPRSLARAFEQDANSTPGEFVEQARIDAARNMLEASDLPLKSVAFECGFGSMQRMRLVFSRQLGVTPSQYRASFKKPSS